MTLAQMIAQLRGQIATKLEQRNTHATALAALRAAETVDEARVAEIRKAKDDLDAEVDALQARAADLQAELAQDEAADRLAREVSAVAPASRAYDQVGRVGAEKRTYSPDTDKRGKQFLSDVAARFLNPGAEASERLSRHMAEERVERAGQQIDRAVGTAAFGGLIVPQYLVEEYAPLARAGRPFANAIRHHDLEPEGMTQEIGGVTTGTSVDDQAAQGDAVSETDIDDTTASVAVRTAAGQQTISRQAAERGRGVEDTTIEDLFAAHAVNIDSKLLNAATHGITNVATANTYTDGTPTPTELYPKLVGAVAAVEALLKNKSLGDVIAVMHSRRWYWLTSAMVSSWPAFGQAGIATQNIGTNFAERYGDGFRGVLPNGTPVIVDNNIATNLGVGTNEDEIYFGAASESHLWEDPNAPMLIKAEQAKASTLQILLVVYSYYAFTHARPGRAHAQKISGTGLIAPTF